MPPIKLLERDKRSIDGDGEGTGEGDSPLPMIEGYAAVFWNDQPTTQYMLYDDLAERIMPGCFDRAIREDDCRGLFNHDPNQLLARTVSGTLRLSVDRTGLKYSIDPPDTDVGQVVVAALRRGDLSGSSFSFIPTEVLWREEEKLLIREIHQVQLFDVGPVTYPAYEATTSGLRCLLRSADQVELPAELVRFRASREARQVERSPVAGRLARYRARARVVEAD